MLAPPAGDGRALAEAPRRGTAPAKSPAAPVPPETQPKATGPAAADLATDKVHGHKVHGHKVHGLAMHGEPVLPAGVVHYPLVDPAARRGGRLTLGKAGAFNSLNPYIIKGDTPEGVSEYVFETLMRRALDEPFSLYGLLAESVEVPSDRNAVTFTLRAEARFSDGRPVTADDVLFTQALLRDRGRPNHRRFYAKVTVAEKLDDRRVRFVFSGDGDREMPLIMGLMPVLPKHRVDPETFEATSLEAPIGSGPYVVARVEAPRGIVYRRNLDWWGAKLPVNVGRFNFDEIGIEYFRDDHSLFEAFRTGAVHLRLETDPSQWCCAYDFPAVREGRVTRAEFKVGLPAPMQGLALNTRRPFLADPRVRRALVLAFDFDWTNKNLFRGLYTRTQSYFHGSNLSAHGRAADAHETALLAPFPGVVAADVLDGTRTLTRPEGTKRDTLREALGLLQQAGYTVREQRLVDAGGRPADIEMLAANRAQERLMLSYRRNLHVLGIDARVRLVDSAEYENRKRKFDFDLIQATWAASLSPGNEQAFRWGSEAADADGSFNYPGVRSPAADAAISAMLAATGVQDFTSAVRALDRVLISGDYVVPLFHVPRQWVARWSHLKSPLVTPLFGFDLSAWWIDYGARK